MNTWSIEGFREEGTTTAELGWGTHEKEPPAFAFEHPDGPGRRICLARMGMNTFVASWVPDDNIVGTVVRLGPDHRGVAPARPATAGPAPCRRRLRGGEVPGLRPREHLRSFQKGPTQICSVFGPTRDALDTISLAEQLPDLELGELVYSENITGHKSAHAVGSYRDRFWSFGVRRGRRFLSPGQK